MNKTLFKGIIISVMIVNILAVGFNAFCAFHLIDMLNQAKNCIVILDAIYLRLFFHSILAILCGFAVWSNIKTLKNTDEVEDE